MRPSKLRTWRRWWICVLAVVLVGGSLHTAWSADPPVDPAADPLLGRWSLTYRVTTKPGHETYTNAQSGTKVVHKTFLTHVSHPGFAVNPDGTFALTAFETGYNRSEEEHTNTAGAVVSQGKWQVYLKARGKVDADGEVVRLTLDQAFGSGDVTVVSPLIKTQSIVSTTPGSDSLTLVARTPMVTQTTQMAKQPGGYVPLSKWGSGKWELKKTSEQDAKSVYRAARDVQLAGGLKVVESVEVQNDKKVADLVVSIGGVVGGSRAFLPTPGSTGTVKIDVHNKGPSATDLRLEIRVFTGDVPVDGDIEPREGNVDVLTYTAGTTRATMERTATYSAYEFTYQFNLPSGENKTVEIKAKDTTPPGPLPYGIQFIAQAFGDLPDPTTEDTYACRSYEYHPAKKTPAKPTPAKPK